MGLSAELRKKGVEMKKEEVLQKKKEYEEARASYHKSSLSTIRVQAAPDDYRGDLSCIKFLDEVQENLIWDGNGIDNRFEVLKKGVVVGYLLRSYGNNGRGKLACESFRPVEGVRVIDSDSL